MSTSLEHRQEQVVVKEEIMYDDEMVQQGDTGRHSGAQKYSTTSNAPTEPDFDHSQPSTSSSGIATFTSTAGSSSFGNSGGIADPIEIEIPLDYDDECNCDECVNFRKANGIVPSTSTAQQDYEQILFQNFDTNNDSGFIPRDHDKSTKRSKQQIESVDDMMRKYCVPSTSSARRRYFASSTIKSEPETEITVKVEPTEGMTEYIDSMDSDHSAQWPANEDSAGSINNFSEYSSDQSSNGLPPTKRVKTTNRAGTFRCFYPDCGGVFFNSKDELAAHRDEWHDTEIDKLSRGKAPKVAVPSAAPTPVDAKILDKKERNRIAAQRLRDKKKAEKQLIKQLIAKWQAKVDAKKDMIEELEQEMEFFKKKLDSVMREKTQPLQIKEEI